MKILSFTDRILQYLHTEIPVQPAPYSLLPRVYLLGEPALLLVAANSYPLLSLVC
jgi:hypothetical protein